MERSSIPGRHSKRGRLIEKSICEPIPDSPEYIARAILRSPRKRIAKLLGQFHINFRTCFRQN